MGDKLFHLLSRFALLIIVLLISGCSSYQPTKNIWKNTKSLWNEYLSPPASVNYDDKGNLSTEAQTLSNAIMGIDLQLVKLERVMINADKPPTQQWLDKLFETFPWIEGFAGVKYDGTILGQQPAESLKNLDFIPLLYEDKKQNSRSLRADVQPTPLGPEVMLATPLYDGLDFLGIVVAYFDMRSLIKYSDKAQDLIILCPTALLWPGKYDFAATPLAGRDWNKIVKESSAGICSNDRGSFFYVIRYLGNLPLIFAIPQSGEFPEGNGNVDQGDPYFPKEREKLPPPPVPERKSQNMNTMQEFGKKDEEEIPSNEELTPPIPQEKPVDENKPDPNEIKPGSKESLLLKKNAGKAQSIQEKPLAGENIEVKKTQPEKENTTQPMPSYEPEQLPKLIPIDKDSEVQSLPGGRPSPFGPRIEDRESVPTLQGGRPSPFGPKIVPSQDSEPKTNPEKDSQENADENQSPARQEQKEKQLDKSIDIGKLPGGRPSPFGPGR